MEKDQKSLGILVKYYLKNNTSYINHSFLDFQFKFIYSVYIKNKNT